MAAKDEHFNLTTVKPDNNENGEREVLLEIHHTGTRSEPATHSSCLRQRIAQLWSLQTLIAILHATSVLLLVLLLPVYLQAINVQGDAYSAVFFVSLFSFIVLAILGSLRLLWDKSFTPKLGNWPESVRNGIGMGIAGITIFYAMDRKRVPCHIQDSLYILAFPFAVIFKMISYRQGIATKEGLSLALLMVGLFLGMDLQLANRFWCRGADWVSPESDRGSWDVETNILWVIIASAGISVFVQSLKNMAEASGNRFANLVISHLAAILSIFALSWTDCLRNIGKGSSFDDMLSLNYGGLSCHFSTIPECGRVSSFGWLFGITWLMYISTYLYLLNHSKSYVWPIAVSSSVLPFTGIVWSIWAMVPIEGVVFAPQFSLAFISSVIGIPLIFTGLYFLSRHY